jgi:hypothetical protein
MNTLDGSLGLLVNHRNLLQKISMIIGPPEALNVYPDKWVLPWSCQVFTGNSKALSDDEILILLNDQFDGFQNIKGDLHLHINSLKNTDCYGLRPLVVTFSSKIFSFNLKNETLVLISLEIADGSDSIPINHPATPYLHKLVEILDPTIGFFVDEFLENDLLYHADDIKTHYDLSAIDLKVLASPTCVLGKAIVDSVGLKQILSELSEKVFCFQLLNNGSIWITDNSFFENKCIDEGFTNTIPELDWKKRINQNTNLSAHSQYIYQILKNM